MCPFVDEKGRDRFKVGVTLPNGKQRWKRMEVDCSLTKAQDKAEKWSKQVETDPDFRPATETGESLSAWFERRCEARRLKLSSVSDDEGRFKTWIEPYVCGDGAKLGDRPVASITADDLDGLEYLDDQVNKGALRWEDRDQCLGRRDRLLS